MRSASAHDRLISLLMAGTAILLAASSVHGQCEIAKLLASDGADFDGFGGSVAISGHLAIAGALGDDDLGNKSGSAYIYRFDPGSSKWLEETKLLASDGAADHRFGWSVAISGDVAVVGAQVHRSAYVYRFDPDSSEWIEEVRLVPWDGWGGAFGYSVAISDDLVIVGALLDSEVCMLCGAAYLFRYDPDSSTWVQEAKLHASDATSGVEAYDLFGLSVSISGDVALVGKPRNTFPFQWGPGAAYVYRPVAGGDRGQGTLWVEEARLVPSNSSIGDEFGVSVAISGDLAIIGATRGDGSATNSGSAHVFRFGPPGGSGSGWTEQAQLVDPDGAPWDAFGNSISISGDRALIGAKWDGDNGASSGSAFIFGYKGRTWIEQAKLLASDGAAGDLFAFSAAISGDVAILGASADDDNGAGSGSAYVFDVAACVCPTDLDDDGSVGILDLLALLAAWGTAAGGPPDFDGDGSVGILDLLTLLTNWGPCP